MNTKQGQEGLNNMGITQQFINMLVANDEEIENIINEMDEESAKQLLKVVIKNIKIKRV